ncbi:MAG: NAD(P)/FAD-dependent oxidoreductase [Bacteroidetes bacterium]|nr:NAD(P)/FAD-dependent oxidoreductase [Bacteroidota bacterium]
MSKSVDVLIIGGGPAGFFAAISSKTHHPDQSICILEGSNKVLSKVLISGGGRCNVTHACFDPKQLIGYYPRGGDFLLNPFKTFHCGHTVEWFESRGVSLKTEEDGRMFPVTNSSKTIADCLEREAKKASIAVKTGERVTSISPSDGGWMVQTSTSTWKACKVILASGSNQLIWNQLERLGIEIIEPVPSLFTFRCAHPLFSELPGISVPTARLTYESISTDGPLLITHRGLSGPAVLKLSAWAAREFNQVDYTFTCRINWLGKSRDAVESDLLAYADAHAKSYVRSQPLFDLPKRLWTSILNFCDISENRNWAEFGKKQRTSLVEALTATRVEVTGKDTFKEEFVTAGGIALHQINPKTMELIEHPGLFAAGEVLDVDALTGGFNFQGSWTTGFLAGKTLGTKNE